MASITLNHIVKTFDDGVTVIPDLNLEIKDKEFVICRSVRLRQIDNTSYDSRA